MYKPNIVTPFPYPSNIPITFSTLDLKYEFLINTYIRIYSKTKYV